MEYVAKFLKAKLWEVDDLSAALLAYCAMAPIALTGRDEEQVNELRCYMLMIENCNLIY